jgi:hypothetical protein
MTTRAEQQKQTEERWVRRLALELNESWDLSSREVPDFAVKSPTGQFGLEVTECQIGQQSKRGSIRRAEEGKNRKLLNEARQKYESSTGICLNLKYLGPVNDLAMEELLRALQEASLGMLEGFAPSVMITLPSGKASIHRSTNSSWIAIRDRAGWISRDGKFLQREIDKKARKLAKYRETFSDVRLLVVADRIQNSGKLNLEEGFRPHLHGFDAVYFLSYPDSVTTYSKENS